MYSVYADGVCIYNDAFALDNMKLASPKLTLEDNAAGSFVMTVPPSNLGYSTIIRMVTDIAVHKDGKEIWAGRVLSENEDFYRNRVLTCEGELAFFNDSTQPPAEYAGGTIREYLEAMIAIHNAKVGDNRKFTIGIVTVVDEDFPTYYTNYEKTITILNALVARTAVICGCVRKTASAISTIWRTIPTLAARRSSSAPTSSNTPRDGI